MDRKLLTLRPDWPESVQAWKGASVMEKAYLAVTFERWGEKQAWLARIVKEFAVCENEAGCYFPNAVPYEGP